MGPSPRSAALTRETVQLSIANPDKNLFGIKWSPRSSGAPEGVAGKSSWATSEEVGGQVMAIMADFTTFKEAIATASGSAHASSSCPAPLRPATPRSGRP